jgi:hypothetical protein
MMKYSPAGVSPETDSHPPRESRTRGRLLRRLAQYGVLGVVLLAPVLIGGAPGGIQVALSFGALLSGAAWAVSRRGDLRLAPFMGMALVGLAGTLVQLLPLPGDVVELVSPRALEIRTEALGRRPAWLPITLDVPATVLAALRIFAAVAILLVTAKAIRWRGRTMQFAVPLVLAGGTIAVISFAQRLSGADTILGLYTVKDMPGSGFFGTFVNGNHASSFFALAALMGLGCLRDARGPIRVAVGVSVAVSALALLSTGSRMGFVGLAAGLLALAGCWLVERFGRNRGLLITGAAAAVLLPLALGLALSQRGPAAAGSLAGVMAEQKVRGWKAGLDTALAYRWTGVGRGAFEGPAAAFRSDAEGVRLVHPENLLVQALSEWGFPLTLALLWLFVVPAAQMVRKIPRCEPVYQGAACGVLAVLVHEIADFGLELPGVVFPAAMALGLCAGRLQMSADETASDGRRRLGWPVLIGALAVWGMLLPLGLWAAPRTSEAEGAVAASLARQKTPAAREQMQAIVHRHPAEYYFELQAARQAMARGSPEGLHHINRALLLFPGSQAPHIMAFHYLAAIGQRRQAAMEYRLAVERGHPFAYDEVARVVGPTNVIRAVPQRPEDLLNLAQVFALAGRYGDAEAASARAVDLAEGKEPARIRRLEIALVGKDQLFQQKAAVELARVAETAAGIELAAEGLATVGDVPGARKLLGDALAAEGNDGSMRLRAARLLFKHGDVEGARTLLAQLTVKGLSMADRIATERLLAEIADKQGNADAAAAARARGRMLDRLRQSSAPP